MQHMREHYGDLTSEHFNRTVVDKEEGDSDSDEEA